MLSVLYNIASFVFVLGVLIFVHELGHFLVAKKVGIRVDAFSLGFPPNILSWRRNGTDYRIGLIPLGGYVKMAGENPDEEVTGSPDEFMSKSIGQRSAVILAGPVMNYLLALVLSILVALAYGVKDNNKVVVGAVGADSPADSAGMQVNDVILAVDGNPITTFQSMTSQIYPKAGQQIDVTWLRGTDTLTKAMVPVASDVKVSEDSTAHIGLVGIAPGVAFKRLNFLGAVRAGIGEAHDYVVQTVQFIYMYATRKIPADSIGGPVFIFQISGDVARRGLYWLFTFMALLSVNLAVLNVLPIPVLDGGQLTFLIIEKIKGSALSTRTRVIAQQIGALLLLVLILAVTYNDVLRFFSKP